MPQLNPEGSINKHKRRSKVRKSKNKPDFCPACKEKIDYINIGELTVCPSCKQPYTLKPEDEYKLLVWQEKYIQSYDPRLFEQIYPILYLYVKKLLLLKLKGKHVLPKEVVEEKVQDTISILYRYYNTKPTFKISDSFGGYINDVLLGVLYNKKERAWEAMKSLDAKFKFEKEGNKTELIDNLIRYKARHSTMVFDDHNVQVEVIKKLENCLDVIMEIIEGSNEFMFEKKMPLKDRLYFLNLIYLLLTLDKNKQLDEYITLANQVTREIYEYTKGAIADYLKSKG